MKRKNSTNHKSRFSFHPGGAHNAFLELKGTEKLVLRGDSYYSIPLATHNLRDFVDRQPFPIFLVVVDVSSEIIVWEHLQQHAAALPEEWRSKGKVSIRIPASNRLADDERLRSAVNAADAYMKSMSLTSSVQADEQRFELLDKRFEARTVATSSNKTTVLEAKEEVNLKLRILAGKHDFKEQIASLIERGERTEVDSGQFEVEGSALVAEAFARAKTVQMAKRIKVDVAIESCVDEQRSEHLRLHGGHFVGGSKEFVYVNPSGYPILLQTKASDQASEAGLVQFDLSLFEGQALLHLPYFEQLHAFVSAVCGGAKFGFTVLSKGKTVLQAVSQDTIEQLEGMRHLLDSIEQARSIAKHYGKNPTFRWGEVDEDFVGRTNDLHWIIFDGSPRVNTTKGITAAMARNDIEKLVTIFETTGELVLDFQTKEAKSVTLFGETVDEGEVNWSFTRMTPLQGMPRILEQLQNTTIEKPQIELCPMQDGTSFVTAHSMGVRCLSVSLSTLHCLSNKRWVKRTTLDSHGRFSNHSNCPNGGMLIGSLKGAGKVAYVLWNATMVSLEFLAAYPIMPLQRR